MAVRLPWYQAVLRALKRFEVVLETAAAAAALVRKVGMDRLRRVLRDLDTGAGICLG